MSTVYLAIQEKLEREVALKIMAPVLVADDVFRQRFLKEGKIIAQLKHPYIVTVHDIGAHQNHYYMALEYARAGNLCQRIRQGLSLSQALTILRQIALALEHAHSQGFVHRDVKSANILFREDTIPLLTDFGVAKSSTATVALTQAGAAVGTPHYMSPEQATGSPVSPKSDLYSLGVIFHEMLTGHCPYAGSENDTPYSILFKHLHDPIPQLPEPFGDLQPFLERMLAKKPEQRFADAGELIATLDAQFPELAAEAERFPTYTPSRLRPVTPIPTPPQASVPRAPAKRARRRVTLSAVLAGVVIAGALAGKVAYDRYHVKPAPPALVLPAVVFRDATQALTASAQPLAELAATYQRILALDPNNSEAATGLTRLAGHYAELARAATANGAVERAQEWVTQGLALAPPQPELIALKRELAGSAGDIERWLAEAEQHRVQGRFLWPVGENAVELYRKVLASDPANAPATARLNELAGTFERVARAALASGEVERAVVAIEQGALIAPEHPGLTALKQQFPRPEPPAAQ